MNQILDYNPSGQKSRKPGSSNKIIKVFAIGLIIFAVAIIGIGAMATSRNNKVSTENQSTNNKEALITVTENETTILFHVTSENPLESVIYSWNQTNEQEVKCSGEKEKDIEIDLPAGDNSFYAKVIDNQGNETIYDREFSSENGKDILKPSIELTVTNEKKLKIVVTDETALDFITYRWNDEEEHRVEVNPDTPTTITATLEIPHGKNDITVVAVDSSNNTNTEQKAYNGLTKPEIKFVLNEEDKSKVTVIVTHEYGIKGISGTMNNNEFTIQESQITGNNVNFELTLSQGLNVIQVSASSTDGTEATAEKEFQYNAGTGSVSTAPDPVQPETKPTVKVEEVTLDNNSKALRVTMSYKNKIAKCELNFNGQDYDVALDADQTNPLTFDLPLQNGSNTIKLKVTGTDGTVTDFENSYAN
jgi:hypothetical protein